MNETPMQESAQLKEAVLAKIRSGRVSMRPRLYFVLRLIAVLFVGTLAFLLSVFAVSFAFFALHESGELFLLGFGVSGIMAFIGLFPWWSALAAGALLFLLEWLLRRFTPTYRVPILYLFVAIVLATALLGALVLATPFHSQLLNEADQNHLPFLGPAYHSIRTPHEEQGEFRGIVTSVGTSTLLITHDDWDRDTDDRTHTVILPPGMTVSAFSVGDRVYIAGSLQDDVIQAYGIQIFPSPAH